MWYTNSCGKADIILQKRKKMCTQSLELSKTKRVKFTQKRFVL